MLWAFRNSVCKPEDGEDVTSVVVSTPTEKAVAVAVAVGIDHSTKSQKKLERFVTIGAKTLRLYHEGYHLP